MNAIPVCTDRIKIQDGIAAWLGRSGDVCGCKRSQTVEGHDRLRLQQTRQLAKDLAGMEKLISRTGTGTRALAVSQVISAARTKTDVVMYLHKSPLN